MKNEAVECDLSFLDVPLERVAEHAPADTIEILWPWFTAALQALDDLRPEGRDRPLYALQYEADFRFEGENGLDLPQPSIPSAFRIALDKLATEAPDAFRIWMTAAESVEFVPVHRLIAYTMGAHPETYASDAHAYLLSDERRWSLGNLQDYSETSTRLVTAVAPFWDRDQIAAYEDRIRNYRPAVPPDLDNPEGRRVWARIRRSHRLRLLRALPTNQRTRATAELVRSEERAIGDGRVGVTFSGVYSPSSIMSVAEMGRAKDDDIINAFQSLPDATRWDHPKYHRKGGNIQLSREFASFAKDNPDRAMRLIERFEPDFGERAAGSAISDMASTADPAHLQAMIVDLAKRGFDGDEFQSYIASAVETLLSTDAAILPELISILRGWLLATPPRDVMIGDDGGGEDSVNTGTATNDDPEGHSLLWGYGGLSVVPSGPFPLLHALARYYLVAGDQDALRELLAACLPLGFESEVWAHLLALLRYLRPAEGKDAHSAIDLLTDILRHHRELVGSREVAFLFGHIHWWAPELVERELPAWATSDRRGVRQGYGELVALLALLHPDREWPKVALGALERGDDPDAKAGAAITAVNLWPDQARRAAATGMLVRIIPNAGDAEWKAIFDLFRVVDELVPDENTSLLLEAIADNAAKAPTVGATFVVERLQSLLPHEAALVARLATTLVEKWKQDLADIRTGTAAHASELVDLAITLHRLGPATREVGTHLFEMLLEIDAYEARTTLDQIDSRFRPTAPVRRPRLQRRQREQRRRRRAT